MRIIKALAYLSFCFLLAAEAAGVIKYYFQNGGLYYLNQTTLTENDNLEKSAESTNFRLQPFFGFALRPGVSLRAYLSPERVTKLFEVGGEPEWLDIKTNNYGFFSDSDYPYHKTNPNQFVIGIFGGSLAHWFSLQGKHVLIEALQSNPSLRGKQLKILNFAAGGYKQPQQLVILNYFLSIGQTFDMVVNIDGFNEIALSDKNVEANISAAMPSVQHLAPFSKLLSASSLDSDYIQNLSKLLTYKQRASSFSKCKLEGFLAAQFLLCDTLEKFYRSKYQAAQFAADQKLSTVSSDSMLMLLPKSPTESSDFITATISQWAESSKQINATLRAVNIKYLHFLQPNQYVSKKVFTVEEEQLARSQGSPYRRSNIEAGYRALALKANDLRKAGVVFYDATAVFDSESAITFSDNCCHLNQRGNEVFARYIAAAIAENLQSAG